MPGRALPARPPPLGPEPPAFPSLPSPGMRSGSAAPGLRCASRCASRWASLPGAAPAELGRPRPPPPAPVPGATGRGCPGAAAPGNSRAQTSPPRVPARRAASPEQRPPGQPGLAGRALRAGSGSPGCAHRGRLARGCARATGTTERPPRPRPAAAAPRPGSPPSAGTPDRDGGVGTLCPRSAPSPAAAPHSLPPLRREKRRFWLFVPQKRASGSGPGTERLPRGALPIPPSAAPGTAGGEEQRALTTRLRATDFMAVHAPGNGVGEPGTERDAPAHVSPWTAAGAGKGISNPHCKYWETQSSAGSPQDLRL